MTREYNEYTYNIKHSIYIHDICKLLYLSLILTNDYCKFKKNK